MIIRRDAEPGTAPGVRMLVNDPWPLPAEPAHAAAHPVDGFDPVQVRTVELAEPIPALFTGRTPAGEPYRRARVLVLLHGVPMGVVWVALGAGRVPPARLASIICDRLGPEIGRHLADDGVAAGPVDPTTVSGRPGRGLPQRAGAQLTGAAGQRRAGHPGTAGHAAADPGLAAGRRPPELRDRRGGQRPRRPGHRRADPGALRRSRGSGWSPNRGPGCRTPATAAWPRPAGTSSPSPTTTSPSIPAWLRRLAAEFADPAVTCVTGLVEPVQLDTRAQWWFESGAGFGRGTERRSYRLADPPQGAPLFPYQLGRYGTGASMALRRSGLPDGWTFDEALGAGSPTQGGEDIDLFLDVLMHGGELVYQPAALCYHRHRADEAGLRRADVGLRARADRAARQAACCAARGSGGCCCPG